MAPAIEPGFGIGVAEGARVNVIVAVDPMVGVNVGEIAIVWVLVDCPGVGEENCPRVGEDNGCKVGDDIGSDWADWVKTAIVKATAVDTVPEFAPLWVAAPRKLQAHRQEVNRAKIKITNGFFIGEAPLD
jgi:hypothetical protein